MSPVVHEEFKDPRDLPPTEEQLEEKRKDRENILVEVIHEGETMTTEPLDISIQPMMLRAGCVACPLLGSEAKPGVGDVVQVHYSTYLADTGKCIESSRNDRRRPFEFAIGLGQVRSPSLSFNQMTLDRRGYCTPSVVILVGWNGVG